MAYAMYKPEVGYGQGLSHIGALLLMWLGEEDAFWALVQLMEKEKYSMDGLYKPGLPQLEKLQEHLGDTVQCTMPTLSKHLEEQGVSLKTCTTHWFTQCFLDAVPFHPALRIWDIFILEGAHVLTTMAYVTLKLNKKRLMKMPQDHIREFLQVTLKQAWDQDDNIVVKHLQASKKDLAKRQCLLPPQAMPGQSCSLDQQPVNVPEQPVPAPTTLQGTETAQAPEPLCPHPESSAPLAETPPVEPATFHPVCGKDEEEEEECIANEEPSESLGVGMPMQASGPSLVPSPAQTPWSVWDKGRLLQWWSLSCLWMPVQSADCPSPVLGTDTHVRASSLPFLEPLGPGPMQAGPAPGLKSASLNNVQETCQEYG
ncbi:USP6 N-terminal-like protein [Ochotona princeps]|uniref:USP6 N-terminal-like protein n=1 Tax=Ochotona princeps TaxID=9978 RepID=UPI002714DAED|nr:USP6 N-terminal-like protein [Ochotona princeps]